MLGISLYINEKLKFSKDFKSQKFDYSPKNRDELTRLLDELIRERGSKCDLNDIDVSQVRSMESLFVPGIYEHMEVDVSEWDVSNVTDMSFMFYGCKNFNCDISRWDVSNVHDMEGMFNACDSFNSDISRWNVSNVADMGGMFKWCEKFNQDISKWNVSKVINMPNMFHGCEKFNQDISGWDVSNVEHMEYMFAECSSFNQDIGKWNVSNVKDISYMFYGCKKFYCDLSSWKPNIRDDGNVKTWTTDTFAKCPKFNGKRPAWYVKLTRSTLSD